MPLSLADILILALVLGFAAFVVIRQLRKSKSGGSTCGGGCSGCSAAGQCPSAGAGHWHSPSGGKA